MEICFFIFVSYIIGGYATSDILRLTRGDAPKQTEGLCQCPNCGHVIPGENQIPILSYMLNSGKCRYCGKKIPTESIVLEIVVPCILLLIAGLFSFSYYSFVAGFICYQLIKIITIKIRGMQEDNFFKRVAVSVVANILIFGACALLFLMINYMKNLFILKTN